jgi:transposase
MNFISLEAAAARAGRSLSTIRRWIERGDLKPWRRAGRTVVLEDDLSKLCDPQPLTEERRACQRAAHDGDADGSGEPAS